MTNDGAWHLFVGECGSKEADLEMEVRYSYERIRLGGELLRFLRCTAEETVTFLQVSFFSI